MFTVVSVSCARFLGAPEGGPCFTVELLHQLLWFDIWNHAFREILGVLDTETRFSLISWVPIEGLIQFLFHWIWSGCAVVCHRRDWVTSHMVAWWPWSARRWRLSFGNPLFAHFTLFPIPAVSQVTCDLVLLVYYDWRYVFQMYLHCSPI